MQKKSITVMGSFVADLAFRSKKLPGWGETVLGSAFQLGPGGKGSNQAVAAARLGARVNFITQLGNDAFGDLARKAYNDEGLDARFIFSTDEHPTGAASIVLDEISGENSIVVVPGAGFELSPMQVDQARETLHSGTIFLTQLEVHAVTVEHAIKLAKSLGAVTILNPAPALPVATSLFPLCDYITPNESEASSLVGFRVETIADAAKAADHLMGLGVQNVVITMGSQGVFVKNQDSCQHVPAFDAGPVVETTGAGDAFNAGFAVGLSERCDIIEAARFGCAVAAICVTRPGTTLAMPRRHEVNRLLA